MGLPELITYNEKEYAEKAFQIASDHNYLLRLKDKVAKLRETSPLFNTELFTKDLESKFIELLK